MHHWRDGHSTSISVCGVWEVRAKIQVFKRKFYTNIQLSQVRVNKDICMSNTNIHGCIYTA